MNNISQKVKKQQLIGVIVSDRMKNTVVVRIDSKKRHSKYHKAYTVSKKFKAHTESNEYRIGDKVMIESCRPYSQEKSFKVIKKL